MKWYKQYLSVFEKPVKEVSNKIISLIQNNIKAKQSETPLASVILIAHNEGKRLVSCLWSLSENKCDFPIEIICINNNSTDDTEEVLKLLGVTYFNEVKKGPGYARQCGLEHAKGKYYLCIDADTLYPPYYIATMIKALQKEGVACAYGLWSFMPDSTHSRLGLLLYESLRDLHLKIQNFKRPELCVRGMVFAFNTEYARKVGFRTDIIRGEDGSLALGLKKYGKLKFITSKKARAMTSNGTLNADGSLFNSFKIRLIKAIKGLRGLFTDKTYYKDEDGNLI